MTLYGYSLVAIAALLLLLSNSSSAFTAAPSQHLSPFSKKNILTTTRRTRRTTSPLSVALPLDLPTNAASESSSSKKEKSPLAPEDQWIANLDYANFAKEVTALGKELQNNHGSEDVDHLAKIVSWRNAAAIVGLTTCWTTPNPLTILALSTWTYASWTMIAHHTCHGGYNRVDAGKFNSRRFALGLVNRCVDWLDWMQPEAWNVEHNRLHHYRLNEGHDPDLVQRNLEFVRDAPVPRFMKYMVVAAMMPVWKWFYYAPNTYKELQLAERQRQKIPLPDNFSPEEACTLTSMIDPRRSALRQIVNPLSFYTKVMAPMVLVRFLALPAVLAVLPFAGPTLAWNALVNLVLADLVTNVHSFVTIVTNHAGEDMYTFDNAVKPRSGSFFVRQIIGSVNYQTGTDPIDFSHGFLNYQIEHHVWPDFSMLQYQKGAPKLKAICAKYGVPYVQESVWMRLKKTVEVMVGKTTMRPFPTSYEPSQDKAAGVTWKQTHGAIDE